MDNKKDGQESVLFVYMMQNYQGFPGFRMNHPDYSNFPEEQEYLLKEGIMVRILDIKRNMKIQNYVKNQKDGNKCANYNGKLITIVYLYHWRN